MANPRKFSEKIALHNQKQAEETAAFEAILRDVSAATQRTAYAANRASNQHLHIQQNIMHQYRGGSLPNVNQMASSNASLDLQTLQNLDTMRGGGSPQSRTDRMHPRDRGRQIGPLRSRPFQIEKSRADCSPYGSAAFLSPPPDTSWRRVNRHLQGVNQLSRTNSDSAIHSSSSLGSSTGDLHSPFTPPVHRRIHEVVGENSGMGGDMLKGPYPWDPKKLQQRPKSCEVPNINIFPSLEQDSQVHIPISNNTGSLPDLTVFQVQSPLTTPLDVEDQQQQQQTYTGVSSGPNLSPNAHLNMGLAQQHPNGSPQHSPGSQRRRMNPSGPSPLVLTGNGAQPNMRLPLSPPVVRNKAKDDGGGGGTGGAGDLSQLQLTPRIRQEYMLYIQQQQLQQQRLAGNMNSPGHQSPSHTSHNHHSVLNHDSPRVPPTHLGPVPKVCVTSHENDPPEPSLTQYRNNINETGCQSPTSPHSQTSYSPSQSPGLPGQTNWNNFDMDPYHIQQQQQQTNALQQQFEHFNMIHDNQQHQVNSTSTINDVSKASSAINTTPQNSLCFSQANNQNLSSSQDFNQQQQQQLQQQQATEFQQQQYFLDNSTQSQMNTNVVSQPTANNKIPEIILSGMSDGSFDADFFNVADVEPLDLDGFQMLDSSVVTDADTENSFRLDQL